MTDPPAPTNTASGRAARTARSSDPPHIVLVVEDNQINQKIVSRMMERLGFEVIIAANGEIGFNVVRERHRELAAVLMDCQMPVMDGFQATSEIRAFEAQLGDARLPIIAVTANALESDKIRCHEVGMDDFVSKPIKRGVLFDALVRHGVTQGEAASG